ncbi:MAG TPA: YdeI/OmpD-associated family protein, partial [Sediminibacterium sp.]
RVVCKLNDQLEFHCAFMPKKEGGHYINIGATICKKLQLKEGSLVKVSFEVDNSDYQFAMPEEFSEVLSSDADANFIFHNLTEGNQRGLIYLVSQVKSSEKRIERALRIANRLKNGVTSPRVILK